jgi:ribosome-binding protein aMBF1 (putative translation factor)
MARRYQEASARRLGRLTDAGQRQRKVFSDAYDMTTELVAIRERRGMTQVQLAEASGILQSEISRIERGSANPTEKTLRRMADALGADLRVVDRTAQSA